MKGFDLQRPPIDDWELKNYYRLYWVEEQQEGGQLKILRETLSTNESAMEQYESVSGTKVLLRAAKVEK